MAPSHNKKMFCVQDVTRMRQFLLAFIMCLWICGGYMVPLMWQSKCMEMELMVLLEVAKLCY